MKVIIAGSRSVTDLKHVLEAISQSKYQITEVVSGTARGVDQLGETFANQNGIPIKQFPAEWSKYGLSAGPKRNVQMAEYADALIAVWDGVSRGTKHMVSTMTKLGKPTFVWKLKS